MNKPRIIIVLLILLGIGLYFAYYSYNKPIDKVGKMESLKTLTAKELYKEFDTNEEEANKKYLDKVLEVTGSVDTVVTNENGGQVITLSSDGEIGAVTVELDPETKHTKTSFEKGENITVKGVCSGKLIDVVLNRSIVK